MIFKVECSANTEFQNSLFLSSSALEVSGTGLEPVLGLDELNPGCKFRVLTSGEAPYNVQPGDDLNWSFYPKVCSYLSFTKVLSVYRTPQEAVQMLMHAA